MTPWADWQKLPRVSGIYRIVHLSTGREYVGSAKDIHHRAGVHRRELMHGKHHSPVLMRIFRKHGGESLAFEIVELVEDAATLLSREQFHIDTRKPVCNVAPKAASCAGVKHTPATCKKRSEATLRRWSEMSNAEKEAWATNSSERMKAWWANASKEQRREASEKMRIVMKKWAETLSDELREKMRTGARIGGRKRADGISCFDMEKLLQRQREWRDKNPEAVARMTARMTATKRAYSPEKKAEIIAKFRATTAKKRALESA